MKPFGGLTVAVVLTTGEVVRMARKPLDSPEEIRPLMDEFNRAIQTDFDSIICGGGISGVTDGGDYIEIPARSVLYLRGLLT